ncbi:hypothetical protein BJ170DRAFT_163343 [Xylariales sp. AK1849]|nr:hypothetical protein BJ170DRAFT_163343 [Xylariales sp. AK1849]
MGSSNFKAIVVGGGPVGLTAAHALTRANIDFVVLERRSSIVVDAGASLVLLPIGLRVLGQLELLDALSSVSSPLAEVNRFDHNGRNLGDTQYFLHFKENHGSSPRVVSRHQLTRVLYDGLPPERQACMLANKKVSDISTTADGVVVSCADGTSYAGSVILGADGAHSLIRDRMRTLALQASPLAPVSGVNEEKPFLTTYRSLWVRFPTELGLRPGDANETHGHDLAIQLFAGDETAVIGMYERLDKPTRERARYSPADEEALVKRWEHLPLNSKGLTVRDAYDGRLEAGLVDLEEGVVEHWSWDRIVLVGDAAHKFTPSTGSGCNNGIIDVVVLVNELHKILEDNRTRGGDLAPSKNHITSAFRKYQNARYEPVTAGCTLSGNVTATATWQNRTRRFVDRYVIPSHILQKYMIDRGASSIAQSPVLDFVEGDEQLKGKIPWAQPMKSIPVRAN